MKGNRFGQAAILTEKMQNLLRDGFRSEKHRLFWDIAVYTGERWGAICQVKVDDVYIDDKRRLPRQSIRFRAATRKQAAGRRADTREVPLHRDLERALRAYQPPSSGWLFPGKGLRGHIAFGTMSQILEQNLERLGIREPISTHSTRRTFITRLYRQGVDIETLRALTGHKDLKVLITYIEKDPARAARAINLL